MKRILWLLPLFLLSLLPVSAAAGDTAPDVGAASMILLHPESGRVLAERCADERRLIASTTKLMTALVASEEDLTRTVTIQPSWTGVEGSSMYLAAGEEYTLRELLEGLLLASGNDAALAIAESVCPSAQEFVNRMNDKAAELGLTNTHFANPHGLNAEEHYSSARDLAALMAAVLEKDPLLDILSMRECRIGDRLFQNHNKLLASCPGVDAGKTGYTKAAGRCLVSACCREGLRLICVTLSDPRDWEDHQALYDWAYDHFELWEFPGGMDVPSVPVLLGKALPRTPGWQEPCRLCREKGERVTVVWRLPRYLTAPSAAAGRAGEAVVYLADRKVHRVPLFWTAEEAGSTALLI